MGADTLSRDLFVLPLSQRLLSEAYGRLLSQSQNMQTDQVQDAFHLTCMPQSLCASGTPVGSLSEEEFLTVLSVHGGQEGVSTQRVVAITDHLAGIIPSESEMPFPLPLADLQSQQHSDPVLGRVIHFVA